MRKILLFLITLYQKTVSPDHGLFRFRYPYGYCRYSPSCSAYAANAIHAYGVIKGICMTFWRILRCNPFSKGGFDPAL